MVFRKMDDQLTMKAICILTNSEQNVKECDATKAQ